MHSSPRPLTAVRGFTLIELMIVTVVVATLAAIAMPSFMGQIRKARRAEAVEAVARIQQAQERWRSTCPTYAALITLANTPGDCNTATSGLGIAAAANARYTYALPATSGSAYDITVTAVPGSSQANDTGCSSLTVRYSAGNTTRDEPACWSN
jgi:type IV pilus assembly protein PilE